MKVKLGPIALLPFLALASSCSSTTEGLAPSAASTLDGAWFFTALPPDLLGKSFSSGSLQASTEGGTYSFSFVGADTNTEGDPGCVIVMDQTNVTVTISGAVGNGTVENVFQQSGATCADTSEHDEEVATFSFDQVAARTPTSTPYDGDWTVSVTEPGASSDGVFGVSVDNGTWQTTGGNVFANGTFSGSMATSTDGTSDLVALKQ